MLGQISESTNKAIDGFQYLINGHPVDKIELIILGGTWTSYPREYQEEFIRDAFYAANTFTSMEKRERLSLEEEQNINDKSKTARIIGVTLEMRPDSINEEEIRILFKKYSKFKNLKSNVNRAITISSPNNHSN